MLLRADGERPTLSTNASVITSSYAANFSSVSPFFSPMEGAMARPVVGRTVVCFRVAQFIVARLWQWHGAVGCDVISKEAGGVPYWRKRARRFHSE